MDEDCTETYTARALAAIGEASITEHDFDGWLAGVLAAADRRREDECLPGIEPLISSADLRTAPRGTDQPPPG